MPLTSMTFFTHRPRFNEAGARMLRKCQNPICLTGYPLAASMRPEHGCSGNGRDVGNGNRGLPASMRPEHGCSGNGCNCISILTAAVASMRPEHGCSGNGYRLAVPLRRPPCFNEAGARMLRKCFMLLL